MTAAGCSEQLVTPLPPSINHYTCHERLMSDLFSYSQPCNFISGITFRLLHHFAISLVDLSSAPIMHHNCFVTCHSPGPWLPPSPSLYTGQRVCHQRPIVRSSCHASSLGIIYVSAGHPLPAYFPHLYCLAWTPHIIKLCMGSRDSYNMEHGNVWFENKIRGNRGVLKGAS